MEDNNSLSDNFCERSVTSNFNGQSEYIPKDVISELARKEAVCEELNRAGESYSDELVKFIVDDAQMLFTICVVADNDPKKLLEAMKYFQREGYCDDKLSAEVVDHNGDFQQKARTHLIKEELENSDKHLWSPSFLKKVLDFQWQVIIPTLSTAKVNHNFLSKTQFPFTQVMHGEGFLGGAFSKVHKVQIQRGYLEDLDCSVSVISSSRLWRF